MIMSFYLGLLIHSAQTIFSALRMYFQGFVVARKIDLFGWRISWALSVRKRTVKHHPDTFHPSLKPGATIEQFKQAPAFETIPEYLTVGPLNGLFPPMLQYGYITSEERLAAIGAEKYDYTRESEGLYYTETEVARIIKRDLEYDLLLTGVWYQGCNCYFLSLCNSYDLKPSSELKDVESKLKEILGEEGPSKWYLDDHKPQWRHSY
ncbi:hypothetical protein BJ138DRAFT_1154705 [Hygrophoropsis aurantiaca]|uniref:Uncharacterized protein n=1 Tax=Hygrophoropsis aurantiaca TaxID=72124 RepID=A0ACB8A9D5_9AGAM|nr:hypothetical protein BJ138DRAFT_1154705 [Hygrophoropsis aurantiaca]